MKILMRVSILTNIKISEGGYFKGFIRVIISMFIIENNIPTGPRPSIIEIWSESKEKMFLSAGQNTSSYRYIWAIDTETTPFVTKR